jgi:hypothetical protein
MDELQENEDGSVDVEMPDMSTEVQEMPDGSAVVTMEDIEGPQESPDFYENMAESMRPGELGTIAMRYLDLLEKDKEARKERDKKYEEGLKRTGMGNDAPGGANLHGSLKGCSPCHGRGLRGLCCPSDERVVSA